MAEKLGMALRTFQRDVHDAGLILKGHYFSEECFEIIKAELGKFNLTKVKKILPPPKKITNLGYLVCRRIRKKFQFFTLARFGATWRVLA